MRHDGGSVRATPCLDVVAQAEEPRLGGDQLFLAARRTRPGWVKSPVRDDGDALAAGPPGEVLEIESRLVAREYFEWTWRSA